MLEIKGVTFSTNNHYNTLQNINLSLDDGEKALLFASSESGVIELFRLILNLESAKQGEIYINKKNIQKANFKDLNVLYIPKEPVFFENKSIEYNLLYFIKLRVKNKAERIKILENALISLGFDGIRNLNVKNLNKFERLKLAICRASFRKIDLVLVENVFESISDKEIEEALNLLNELIEKNNSAVFIWIENKELQKHFKAYKKYTLEYGTLNPMP